jgi:hypothetical protein
MGVGIWLFDVTKSSGVSDPAVAGGVEFDVERDPNVPSLPFDDNPDPSQCGIPVQWGDVDNRAWLSGMWEGELIQREVLVYDSHLRISVTGGAPHGTEVEIILFQENPVLDYYLVRIPGDSPQEGWVPEPFLSFAPIA